MGANSKQRREMKKRKALQEFQERQRRAEEALLRGRPAEGGRPSAEQSRMPPPPSEPTPGERANAAIELAKRGLRLGNALLIEEALDALIALPEHQGQRVGCIVTESILFLSFRALWTNGWQPLDIVHLAAKELSTEHRAFAIRAIGIESATTKARYVDERWRQQLVRIGAITNVDPDATDSMGDSAPPLGSLFPSPAQTRNSQLGLRADLSNALGLIELISRQPALPFLIPPPAQEAAGHITTRRASTRLDDKMLDRVRALLAKAESTTFEEEASALTAKAQELMARHSIDIAMLDSRSATQVGAAARRIHIDDPYLDAKCSLLGVVANENRCKSISTKQLWFATVFGFDADLDIVELLFTSLLTQATSAMIAAGSVSDRTGKSRTKSFRQAFLIAFASRIGERLRAANQTAAAEATQEFGEALLPVLVRREEEVEELRTQVFPKVTYKRTSVSNAAGWAAGREAADKASIDVAKGSLGRK